jgi:hypothetical protein
LWLTVLGYASVPTIPIKYINKMKLRIKKKLLKKQKAEALSITNVIGCEPTTCKVLASKETLVDLGIDLDLTNVFVEHIRDFKDGYSEVRIKNEEISKLLDENIYEYYDIPKYWLEFE